MRRQVLFVYSRYVLLFLVTNIEMAYCTPPAIQLPTADACIWMENPESFIRVSHLAIVVSILYTFCTSVIQVRPTSCLCNGAAHTLYCTISCSNDLQRQDCYCGHSGSARDDRDLFNLHRKLVGSKGIIKRAWV